jgi:hypothetical protein
MLTSLCCHLHRRVHRCGSDELDRHPAAAGKRSPFAPGFKNSWRRSVSSAELQGTLLPGAAVGSTKSHAAETSSAGRCVYHLCLRSMRRPALAPAPAFQAAGTGRSRGWSRAATMRGSRPLAQQGTLNSILAGFQVGLPQQRVAMFC